MLISAAKGMNDKWNESLEKVEMTRKSEEMIHNLALRVTMRQVRNEWPPA